MPLNKHKFLVAFYLSKKSILLKPYELSFRIFSISGKNKDPVSTTPQQEMQPNPNKSTKHGSSLLNHFYFHKILK